MPGAGGMAESQGPCSTASWKELASVSVPASPRLSGALQARPGESTERDNPGWMPWVRCDCLCLVNLEGSGEETKEASLLADYL